MNMKIGIFDPGINGIPTMKALVERLPEYSYEYYGDTTNTPYQAGEEALTTTYVRRGIEHLMERECALVICVGDPLPDTILRNLRTALGSRLPLIDASEAAEAVDEVDLFLDRHPALVRRLERGGGGRNIVLSEHSATTDAKLSELLKGTFVGSE